jgi:Uma2 family endonuclease
MIDTVFISEQTFTSDEFEEMLHELSAYDDNHYELLDGRIVVTPPAGWPHGECGSGFVTALRLFVRKHKLGRVFDSSQGFCLGNKDTVGPDASFISHERWAQGDPPVPGRLLNKIPNLVAEIISPTTSGRDRVRKRAIYERHGIDEYWLIDPSKKTIEVLALKKGRYTVFSSARETGRVQSKVLKGFSVQLSDIFPD